MEGDDGVERRRPGLRARACIHAEEVLGELQPLRAARVVAEDAVHHRYRTRRARQVRDYGPATAFPAVAEQLFVTEHRVEVAGDGVDLEPPGQAEEALLAVEGQPRQPVGVVRCAGQVASREQDVAAVPRVVHVFEAMRCHHRQGADHRVAAPYRCHGGRDVIEPQVQSGQQVQRGVLQRGVTSRPCDADGVFRPLDGQAAIVGERLRDGDRGFGQGRAVRERGGLGEQVGLLFVRTRLRHDSRSPSDEQRHPGEVIGGTAQIPE